MSIPAGEMSTSYSSVAAEAAAQAESTRNAGEAAGFRLKAKDLMPLSERNDVAAARRVLGHLGAIVVLAAALWWTPGTWWAVPLTVLLGYVLAFLFTLEHETAHQTAFRSRAWNHVFGHLAGFAIFLPYEYYRVFHWDHHRYTQDPARDPELATPLPATRPGLLWTWSGMPIWISRLRLLYAHGVSGKVTVPWVPPEKRSLIVREARGYLFGYGLVLAASLAVGSAAGLWLWLLPLMIGQLFLRPYLLAEHTGCGHGLDMLENTRTTYTNAIVHFFAWNMPFHAEHHAYPAVPFHALPRLNKLLAEHIVNTEPGYRAATRTVVRHLLADEQAAQSPCPPSST